MLSAAALVAICLLGSAYAQTPLRVIHMNDNHARFDPQDASFNVCKDVKQCFGGFARIQTASTQLRAEVSGEDVLFVHAGDQMAGMYPIE